MSKTCAFELQFAEFLLETNWVKALQFQLREREFLVENHTLVVKNIQKRCNYLPF